MKKRRLSQKPRHEFEVVVNKVNMVSQVTMDTWLLQNSKCGRTSGFVNTAMKRRTKENPRITMKEMKDGRMRTGATVSVNTMARTFNKQVLISHKIQHIKS